MGVVERLIKDNNKKSSKKEKEPELVEMYMERQRNAEPINKMKSAFESKYSEGINTRKSVFDRKATFNTDNNE